MTDHAEQLSTAPAEVSGPPQVTPIAAARARWAVTGVFLVNGLVLATYIARIPSIKSGGQFGDAEFGVILALLGVAALLTMQFVGGLVGRFGSARIIAAALMLMPLALVGVGLAGNTVQLAAAVILLGVVHGAVDVAMNAHAVVVERVAKRPIMNGCHAAWSISAVVASLVAWGLIRARLELEWHFLLVGAVVLAISLPLTRYLLPASIDRRAEPTDPAAPRGGSWRSGWTGRVLMYGAMGFTVMICEAAVVNWSGIFLHETRGATLAVASLGYAAFASFQTAVRLFGDRLNSQFGAVRLFRVSGVIAVAGLLVVVLIPAEATTIAGFALLGAGTAVLLPLIFSAVGHAGGEGPGAATFVSRATTFTYGGILLGPALVGWFAAASSLTSTFAGLIPLVVAIALNGRVMASAYSSSSPKP